MKDHIRLVCLFLMVATIALGAGGTITGNTDMMIDSARLFIVIQVCMATATGMPHPELLREMGSGRYLLTWLYNILQVLAQNLEKIHLPLPGSKVVEVERKATTTVRTEGGAAG